MPFPVIQLNDGNKIPSVAFGSGSVNKGKDIHQYVEQALDAGFTHIDTAQYYANEQYVGLAIRKSGISRDELYVTSKWAFASVQDAFHASLNNLGLTHLDLYLIHEPTSVPNGDFEGIWRQFEKFKEDGLTKSIGVSNFTVEDLQKLLKVAKIKPAVNQIHLHPYNYAENAALLEFHVKHGIATEAYGSLAPITTYPNGPVDAPLKAAATRLGITPTQVVFLWVRAKGAVVVTTSSNRLHLEEYLAVGDLPPLTEEEVAAIDKAGAQGPPSPPAYSASDFPISNKSGLKAECHHPHPNALDYAYIDIESANMYRPSPPRRIPRALAITIALWFVFMLYLIWSPVLGRSGCHGRGAVGNGQGA